MITGIGDIGNTYGGLRIKEQDGKFKWIIDDCFEEQEDDWQEIPESLYRELLKHERGRHD